MPSIDEIARYKSVGAINDRELREGAEFINAQYLAARCGDCFL